MHEFWDNVYKMMDDNEHVGIDYIIIIIIIIIIITMI